MDALVWSLFLCFYLLSAAVAEQVPDVRVNLAGDAASEVRGLFAFRVDSPRGSDLLFQMLHFVQQAVEEFRAA